MPTIFQKSEHGYFLKGILQNMFRFKKHRRFGQIYIYIHALNLSPNEAIFFEFTLNCQVKE